MIELKSVSKVFQTKDIETRALDDICLKINSSEFVSIMGPSGCGKSTLLNLIGLLDQPTAGTILIHDTDVSRMSDREAARFRNKSLGFVFQNFHLVPSLNVMDNVELPLLYGRVAAVERKERVKEVLNMVGLSHRMKHFPSQLSGGQCQRVAIARALVNEPKVLLLDEPLGALDLKLRKTMQIELKKIQQQVGITFVYVTHDQEEALTMSDKIVVMNEGLIQQIGSPIDIYNEPENRFVANFIGESNIVEGHFIKDYLVEWHGQQFECVDKGFEEGQEVDIVLRPEDLDIVEPGRGKIAGEVVSVIFKGVHYEIMVRTENQDYKIHTTDLTEVGKKVDLDFWPEDIHVMEPMGTY